MLGILESSLGPFAIIFAVPVSPHFSTEKSLSNTRNLHPIPPPPATAPPRSAVKTVTLSPEVPDSPQAVPRELGPEEYERRNVEFKKKAMLHRNSSAIAKQVLTEYADDDEQDITSDPVVFASSSSAQRKEFARLEAEIRRHVACRHVVAKRFFF